MPGARHRTFRLGDRTELLVEFVLNTIAFTARVPRQEDVGHDLYCVLSELHGGLLLAGPFFTVQVKSNRDPIVFEKEHELAWIRDQQNPLFVAVGHRDTLRVDIYSTWSRLNGILRKGANKIVLELGDPDAPYEPVSTAADGSEQRIPVGKPAVSVVLDEMMDEKRADHVRAILKGWIALDRQNIVNTNSGMNWVTGPTKYETNEPLGANCELVTWFYWNARNLPSCQLNFGRCATGLRLVLRLALSEAGEKDTPWLGRIQDLERALESWAECLEPLSKRALREQVGLDVASPP